MEQQTEQWGTDALTLNDPTWPKSRSGQRTDFVGAFEASRPVVVCLFCSVCACASNFLAVPPGTPEYVKAAHRRNLSYQEHFSKALLCACR